MIVDSIMTNDNMIRNITQKYLTLIMPLYGIHINNLMKHDNKSRGFRTNYANDNK